MKLLSPQLQAFLLVCQYGTVHEAARRLHLSQVAVTERIQSLEAILKTTLFLRSRRGMTLTEAGHGLLTYASSCRDLEGDFWSRFGNDASEETRQIKIHGPSSVMRSRIIPAVERVMAKNPRLTVEFQMADTVSGVVALKRGDASIAVLPRREVVAEFSSKLLKPERYVLVGPASWRNRSLKEILAHEHIIDFDPTDEMTWRWLEKHGLQKEARTNRHFVNNTDALAGLVIAGRGYSVLAEEFARPLVAEGKLTLLGRKSPLLYELGLAWYERRHPSSLFRELVDAIR